MIDGRLPGRLPTVERAEGYFKDASELVPGPWVMHCQHVAEAARRIAAAHPELDAEVAYILGLLHDIGYRGGFKVPPVRHLLDGYSFLRDEGFDGAARVCLTHSFPAPIRCVDAFASPWDCAPEERQLVQDFVDGIEYTTYDRLIQLCDCLGEATGFCLIEKRLVDVALRHGFNAWTIEKWRAFLGLKREFDEAIGTSIYRLLPGVVENTFRSRPCEQVHLAAAGAAERQGGRRQPFPMTHSSTHATLEALNMQTGNLPASTEPTAP